MKVTVEIHPRDLWKLTEVAEKQGMKLNQFLYRSAMTALQPKKVEKEPIEVRIASLNAQGMHDGEISVALGLTRAQVATKRRKLGLQANSPYKKKKEEI